MFVPVGFVVALVSTWRSRTALMALVLALPLAIEGIQLVATGLNRACESGDVVDNATGAVVGFALGLLGARLLPSLRAGAGRR
jgi:glycopeptide antibiotics resistance protein